MSYHSEPFSQQSIANISSDIEDYLTTNSTYVPVSVSLTTSGAGFYAVLVYQIP